MTKNGLIIPFYFIVVSGCSIFDSGQMTPEPATLSVPVVENEAQPVMPEGRPAANAPVAPGRSMSADDIRRLQARLRELRFNPGPIDGVPGAKTKTAFARLEMGCAKLEPLSENLPPSVVHEFSSAAKTNKVPSRADTIILQSQLRSAGFDPGPVDGVLGARTRSLVAILPSSCSMAKEFHGALDQAPGAANLARRMVTPAEPSKAPALSIPARNETAKQTVSVQTASQDEVRILQLRLRDAGFDPGPFDGVMGAKTRRALEQYETSQRNRKIKASFTTTKIGEQY